MKHFKMLFFLAIISACTAFTCKKENPTKTVTVDFTTYGSLNAIITFEGEQGQGNYQAVSNGGIVTLQMPCNGTYAITLGITVEIAEPCVVFLNGILSMPLHTGSVSSFGNELDTHYGFDVNCR